MIKNAVLILVLAVANIHGAARGGLGSDSADIVETLRDAKKREQLCEVVARDYYDKRAEFITGTHSSYGIQFNRNLGTISTPDCGKAVLLSISKYSQGMDFVTRTLYVNPEPYEDYKRIVKLREAMRDFSDGYVYRTMRTFSAEYSWKDKPDGTCEEDVRQLHNPKVVNDWFITAQAKKAGTIVLAGAAVVAAYQYKESITKKLTALLQQGQKVTIK